MKDTNQLPEPELGYIQTDKSNQPAFSARQMREAMKHALQARAILALRPERVPDEVEKCAVVAWAHFMDTCRKKRVSPADWGDWCAADAIRKAHHDITAQAKKGTP